MPIYASIYKASGPEKVPLAEQECGSLLRPLQRDLLAPIVHGQLQRTVRPAAWARDTGEWVGENLFALGLSVELPARAVKT